MLTFHNIHPLCVLLSLSAVKMRLICFWCFILAAVVRAQDEGYYTPQTFRKNPNYQQQGLFTPTSNDVIPQGTSVVEPWRGPAPDNGQWRDPNSGSGTIIPKADPWRLPYSITKEQQAAIIHHKQSLTSNGAFRFEYASDNGLAAGEQIEPDGSRVGAYQYKDPSGQLVKLKYRAGKNGFQILEGSHLPKSPEPVPPSSGDNYYQNAYQQQRQQYTLQQQHNQQKHEPEQQRWGQNQSPEGTQKAAPNQYFINNWRPHGGPQDDGQYHANELDSNKPHNFGEGYAFSFQG